MGMSGDLKNAIREEATPGIGTAIYGERDYGKK